jgi:hypothetical protein
MKEVGASLGRDVSGDKERIKAIVTKALSS